MQKARTYRMHLESAKTARLAVWLHQLDSIAEGIAHIPAFKPLQGLILYQLVPGLFEPL